MEKRLQSGQLTWRNSTEKNGPRLWQAPAGGAPAGFADVIIQRVNEAARP